MNKDDFHNHSRYTVTLTDEHGKARPSKFYVLHKLSSSMIVRLTEREGILKKIGYDSVKKIVTQEAVPEQNRISLPPALLEEKFWKDRDEMQHYSSTPHSGK
ncbi:MAG: hypothetical protein OEX00_00155 [Gammaproteobacteria bacterium]|nr:hypothetical protein [Gammaproteobacteria bacterium]MDH5692814.1 hypothetical protein [Gammaproteobacteria bacterium]